MEETLKLTEYREEEEEEEVINFYDDCGWLVDKIIAHIMKNIPLTIKCSLIPVDLRTQHPE